MSFDHGILNVPLCKRGNIDNQIDAYKAGQAREAAAKRKADTVTLKANKVLAKAALAEILAEPELVNEKAKKLGITRRELVAVLNDRAKWKPAFLLRLHADWLLK